MIFVTVGTHEQPFNRLIKEVDNLANDPEIKDSFFIQTGFSDYKPKNCQWKKFLSYEEMNKLIREANIVITHGGPASFIAPLELGKIPIVVPREKKFDEHINNHQVEFVKLIDQKMHNIIPVYDINELKSKIENYNEISESNASKIKSNNANFIKGFDRIVNSLFS
ncbi:MAG: PssE/Cps14G family polysaccharide biosynthesis glycosyltransferase [Limosilactobacillus sp.]